MTLARLSPGAADALLFDLGRVVLNIDFGKALACWADHAGCAATDLAQRFSPDESYRDHETGKLSDAEYFQCLRASLGIGITDDQFLEGWNAIFAGEMPDIADLLGRAGKRRQRAERVQRVPAARHRTLSVLKYKGGHSRTPF